MQPSRPCSSRRRGAIPFGPRWVRTFLRRPKTFGANVIPFGIDALVGIPLHASVYPSVHGRTYTTLGLGRVAAKGLNRIEGVATSSAVGARNTG